MATTASLADLLAGEDLTSLGPERLHAVFVDYFLGEHQDDDGDIVDDEPALSDASDVARDAAELAADTDALVNRRNDDDDDDEGSIADSEHEARMDLEDAQRFGGATEENAAFATWIANDPVDWGDETQRAEIKRRQDRVGQQSATLAMIMGDGDEATVAAPGARRVQPLQSDLDSLAPPRLQRGDAPRQIADDEPAWIVNQMLNHFGRSLYGCRVEGQMLESLCRDVSQALRLMLLGHKEPAVLSMHHRDSFMYLRHCLMTVNDTAAPSSQIAGAGLPYGSITGRHTTPLSPWRPPALVTSHGLSVHKPADLALGRALWEVLELHSKYHGVNQLRMEARLAFHRASIPLPERFDALAAKSSFDALVWRNYAIWAADYATFTRSEAKAKWTQTRSASLEILWRDAQQAFRDFCAMPKLDGVAMHDTPKSDSPDAWAASHVEAVERITSTLAADGIDDGSMPPPPATGDLLRLCSRAALEVLSSFPPYRLAVYAAYVESGFVIFTAASADGTAALPGRTSELRIPIRRLLHEGGSVMLELLEKQQAKAGRISLAVPSGALNQAIAFDQWIEASVGKRLANQDRERWVGVLRPITTAAIKKIMGFVEAQVLAQLKQSAEQHAIANAVVNLGNLCAEGPFEVTDITIDSSVQTGALWEARWEDVEAVPRFPGPVEPGAVCGVTRSASLTWFTVVDASGRPRESVHWLEIVTDSPDNARTREQQEHRLVKLLNKYTVVAIGVAVQGGAACGRIFSAISKFLNEKVPALHVCPELVWVSPAVAHVASRSELTAAALPGSQPSARLAASVAMHLQNPLASIARLFDPNELALELPIGAEAVRRAGLDWRRAYRAMQEEMSLWVSATGVEINSLIRGPNPEYVLQFVAGFDLKIARDTVHAIERGHAGLIASRDELGSLLDGPSTALNALSCLRVRRAVDHAAEPLDETLIPKEQYGLARLLASMICSHPLALADLAIDEMLVDCSEKSYGNIAHGLQTIIEQLGTDTESRLEMEFVRPLEMTPQWLAWSTAFENAPRRIATVLFVVSELLACGRPTMQRPYRKLSRERFFELATGVTYSGDSSEHQRTQGRALLGANKDASAQSFAMVTKGQQVDGVFERINVPKSGDLAKASVSIKLSFNVKASMSIRDVSNHDAQEEIRRLAALVADSPTEYQNRRLDEKDMMFRSKIPQLNPGAPITCIIVGCHYESCELRVEWVDSQPFDAQSVADFGGSALSSRGSAAGSVLTQALVKRAALTARLFTNHPRFRDWTDDVTRRETIHLSLGEFIVRPAKSGGGHCVIAVVVSNEVTGTSPAERLGIQNIRCHEQRDHNGKLVYIVSNHSATKYDSIDHVVSGVVNPIMKRVRDLMTHPKFFNTPNVAQVAFLDQLEANRLENRLIYGIVCKAGSGGDNFYTIVYQSREVQNMQHRPITVTGSGFVIKTRYSGLQVCTSVEGLIATFKKDFMQKPAAPAAAAAVGASAIPRRSGAAPLSATAMARI